MMQNHCKLAFIGGGNMATALIGGLAGKLTAAENIHVVDVVPETLARLRQQLGVQTAERLDEALCDADVIVLATKPQQLHEVLTQLRPFLNRQLLVSIAAGIRTVDMTRWLGGYQAIVRCMPNTPALIGQGITGMFALPAVSEVQRNLAQQLLQTVGQILWLDEEAQIDVVTAVSGSGPAYVFYLMEAMQRAAQELGLNATQAEQLVAATLTGASLLAAQSSDPVGVLREKVTSKGGTTYAALSSFAADHIADGIVRGIHAAAVRGQEMGEELGKD